MPNEPTIMSKSKSETRRRYWAGSTVRTVIRAPSRSRFFPNGSATRSKSGLRSSISNSIGAPLDASTSRPPRTVQPDSRSRARARRRFRRSPPGPSSVRGGAQAAVKTRSGTRPRYGSRIASSASLGRPDEASSEFEKKLALRWYWP